MNKKIWIVMIMVLMLGSFTSALWTDSTFELDKTKQLEEDSKTNFGTYTITDHAWYAVVAQVKGELE